jgi:hypothetical protein
MAQPVPTTSYQLLQKVVRMQAARAECPRPECWGGVGCGASRSLPGSICARGMLRAAPMFVVGAISEPKPAEAQSRERSCPGPSREILNESGEDASTSSQGFANYGPFTITGDSFVVTMDASSSRTAGAAVAVSQVGTAPTPEVIRRQAFRAPRTASLLIQNGPGDYVVSVGFAGSDYTVTVEECTGAPAGGTSGTSIYHRVRECAFQQQCNRLSDETCKPPAYRLHARQRAGYQPIRRGRPRVRPASPDAGWRLSERISGQTERRLLRVGIVAAS